MPSPEHILAEYWGYKEFRPLQKEIISSVINKQDTIALLPTGGGKSLCYQLPSLVHNGVTLVITPLVALMQDQVAQLKERGISAAYLSAGMHISDIKRTLTNTAEGAYDLLYVSPERLQSRLLKEYLPVINIQLIAIDEAHCVSQWGHDFRPDYLKIAELKQAFKKTPFIAVTASANQEVVEDITKQLKLYKPVYYCGSFERPNINYTIKYTEQKNRDIIEILSENKGAAVVYCRTRKQTELLSKQLQNHGISTLHYHAGMSHDKREEHQQLWSNNKVQVIAATTAFGMGIDKPDVRTVIHYDIPEHIEAYYQESGRAGRDGNPANAILLYNQPDIKKLEDSIEIQFPPYDFIRKVYQSVAEYLQLPIGVEPYSYYDFDLADFCKKFKLPAPAAARALKLLEQEGLWTLGEAVFKPTTVRILADRHEIDSLGRRYNEFNVLLTTLLRLYGTLYYQPTPVNIKQIAKHLKTKIALVTKLLEQLDKMEVIQFTQPKEGPQLFFHHYRVDSNHLTLNTNRINELKRLYKQRTEAIISFITNDNTCRTRFILHYFGQEYKKICGHCDVCRSTTKHSYAKEIKKLIINELKKHTESSISSIIDSIDDYSKEEVVDAIRSLVDDGTISLSNNTLTLK